MFRSEVCGDFSLLTKGTLVAVPGAISCSSARIVVPDERIARIVVHYESIVGQPYTFGGTW